MPISGEGFSPRYSLVAGARGRWSDEDNQTIVAEALQPGVNVSSVARRYGIKPNLLFRWRKGMRSGGRASVPSGFYRGAHSNDGRKLCRRFYGRR